MNSQPRYVSKSDQGAGHTFKVFLSHSTQDRAWVEWLASEAQMTGVTVYMAEHDVQPGTPLAEKVQSNIASSDAVIVLLSSISVSAPYVQQEVGYALGLKKPVIPLVQTGILDTRLAMLQGLEFIPFDFTAPESGLHALLESLRRLVDQRAKQLNLQQQQRDDLRLVLAVVALLLALALTQATH